MQKTFPGGTGPVDYDVVVVGGGPAGSTTATLVAQDGHRVLLLEKEQFPRYQIGESLLPATIHGICRLLGVSEELAEAGFTTKRGGSFRWGRNPNVWTFAFSVSPQLAGPADYAFQVERMKFDKILLDNASRCGVTVRYRCQAVEVLREGDRVTGVLYTDDTGVERVTTSKWLIDASGNTSRLRDSVGGHRSMSPDFRSVALFGYFAGGKRLPAPNSGNILSASFPSGWIWYIPLARDLTSVGVVVRSDHVHRLHGDKRAAYHQMIAECPIVHDYLKGVPPATTPPYDRLRTRRDYSYHHTTLWSPGMALVGDAAMFVDPVISTGVHLATYGGLLAARAVNTALAGDIEEAACFAEYEARMRREYRKIYDFLVAFYETHDEQAYFRAAQHVTGRTGDPLEAFVDLVGGIASHDKALPDGSPLSADAKDIDAIIGRTHDDGDVIGLHHVPVIAEALGETIAMRQLRPGKPEHDGNPLLDRGLGVSADGRRWTIPARAVDTPPT
ncbi:tryptophan 7-halogenase [Nocardia sp. CC227C]|uniref:tryptophan 7-halogenase n=1 Tax=Nocardia sp. CC227C TaxID=3044562 RepID=UPI00278BB435|nr:tryptophan 7-halogenase [Nocardia sp. CC227C]